MTVLHPDRAGAPSAIAASADPRDRYQSLASLVGLWVILVSGDCAVEGWIVKVMRPDLTSDAPAPLVTLDTGYGFLTGPVLAGDIISSPAA